MFCSMRILVVTNLYGPESRGGAENIAKQAAEEMVRQGHEVTVLSTTGKPVSDLASAVDDGVMVLRYHPGLPYHILHDAKQPLWKRLLWHKLDVLQMAGARKATNQAIEQAKPDLIITHNLRGMGMGVARAVRASGVRWMHTLHDIQLLVPSGLYWFDHVSFWQRSIVTAPYQWWMKRVMGSPDMISAPTNYIADAHREAGFFAESDVRVLQTPVNLPADLSRKEAQSISIPLKLVVVGQLEPNKGLHVLIEALRHVEDVQLDIVGDGSAAVDLAELALQTPKSVTVNLHGRVPHTEVFRYMREADALVFPSVAIENCPGAILEANVVGLPVIGSDQGGVPELIHPEGLFEPGNVRLLVQAIERLRAGDIKPMDIKPSNVETYVKHLLA